MSSTSLLLFWWSWFSFRLFTFTSTCLLLFVDGFPSLFIYRYKIFPFGLNYYRAFHTIFIENLFFLYEKSPCLWALVWPCNLSFDPKYDSSHKVYKIGYHFRKWGINSQDCNISCWQSFHWMKNTKGKSKTWGETLKLTSNLGEKTSLFPCFFPLCIVFILISP